MEFIKKYWDTQAAKYKESHKASWQDNFAIDLEVELISQYIREGDTVLDVGCANGYSTIKQLKNKPQSIIGVDFSEEMIKSANRAKNKIDGQNLNFLVGDIQNLPFNDQQFDIVYTTRVLINLPNWELQVRSIEECLRVTRNGGITLFSEGFWEPLMLLNAIRGLKSLPPLEEHDFNKYLKKKKLEEYLKKNNLSYQVIDFSSIYYLGSRFLRELVTNPDDYPGYSNPINKIFHDIEKEFSGGDFGIQQAFVIQKR